MSFGFTFLGDIIYTNINFKNWGDAEKELKEFSSNELDNYCEARGRVYEATISGKRNEINYIIRNNNGDITLVEILGN